jgi:hypothetical protein
LSIALPVRDFKSRREIRLVETGERSESRESDRAHISR